MNLEENINRIKEVMGVINEQAQVETISHTITQPYPNPNWDTVHAFSTKASDSDLEDKVGLKLKSGNYRVVDVRISTTIIGNTIQTKGDVDLKMIAQNEMPHISFTTRGSIGIPGAINKEGLTYVDRHDKQVKGIEDRLKAYYKSNDVKTFGPFEIAIDKTNYAYKQTFFAIEGTPTPTNQQTPTTITANSMDELRTNLKTQTQNISIDPNTITFDSNKFSVSFNPGNTKIKSMSIIYDNEGKLDDRLENIIKPKNPTMVVAKKDNSNINLQWAVVYFT